MALIRLIYVSNSHRELTPSELETILQSSVQRNHASGLTGMLLYSCGSFMQVLEGEPQAVDETFRRISTDSRHGDVVILEREPITERSFDRWSMGFKRLGRAEAASLPGYAPVFANGFDAAIVGAQPGLALELLQEFAHNQR